MCQKDRSGSNWWRRERASEGVAKEYEKGNAQFGRSSTREHAESFPILNYSQKAKEKSTRGPSILTYWLVDQYAHI